MESTALKTLLLEMEKSILEAYKNQDEKAFRQNFAQDYIGIANDGMKSVDDEVAKMKQFDLQVLYLSNEKVMFPSEGVAVVTYKMVSEGNFKGQEISGSVYTSTVYVEREGNWKAVLHTESNAQ